MLEKKSPPGWENDGAVFPRKSVKNSVLKGSARRSSLKQALPRIGNN